ncbi:hypothetical protein [Spiroplasma ixodetis]|uniref:Spiroplasmavirus-related protein n=1 Tax=Spiroplasma ixodetis TaxID=2141 RepID=A0ABN7BTG6_9MOLU
MGLVFWKKHKEKNQTKNSNIELKTSKEKSPWNNVLKFLQVEWQPFLGLFFGRHLWLVFYGG